jgi:5-methylcytosine-specific restriction endonuclease McrA
VEIAAPPTRVAPLTPQRFGLQTTIDRETQDDLARARELLGPGTQVPEALKRALRLLVVHLEKQKLAAVSETRRPQRPSRSPRHIPAEVKRLVRARDRDQCTFVSDSGHRCEERSGLEYDHIDPVARGGRSTVGNLRLRCRGHNQMEADRVFGAEFMTGKRGQAGPVANAGSPG